MMQRTLTFTIDTPQQHAFHEQITRLHDTDRLPVRILPWNAAAGVVCILGGPGVIRRSRRRQHFLRIVGEEVEHDVELRVIVERRHHLSVGVHNAGLAQNCLKHSASVIAD